jgi:hypothetical protein
MLNHVILVELKEGVTDAQADAALEGYAALQAVIPEIRACTVGRDAGLNPNAADMALITKFNSVEDFASYREHPAHVAFGRDVLLPISEKRTLIQFFSED